MADAAAVASALLAHLGQRTLTVGAGKSRLLSLLGHLMLDVGVTLFCELRFQDFHRTQLRYIDRVDLLAEPIRQDVAHLPCR
ncbi:MAG TPA: hypothetical protein VHH34_23180 [Pseudonocardiaceae bacterium]|nr:hypothetical protein [Pseudonocardiaceae bacterium]